MKQNQNIEDKDWELLAHSVYEGTDGIPEEELDSATKAVFSSENEKRQFQNLVHKVDLYFTLKKYRLDEAWSRVEQNIHQTPRSILFYRKIWVNPVYRLVAAVIVIAFVVAGGYFLLNNSTGGSQVLELTSSQKIINTFALPDGSLVSLNSKTKVLYPETFTGNTREVSIEGEAFFEVKPDKNKPFIIHAGKAQIKVLGTSFSVNAYPENRQVEVIVQTGKVQVVNKSSETANANELILVPGDKGTLVYANNSLLKAKNQDPNFISWKTRALIFKATPLREVINDLGKVYKVNIRLADPKLNDLLLTAQFNNYPLEFILKVIENTFQLDVEEVDGQYLLKERT
jgi:transmembrane sensor